MEQPIVIQQGCVARYPFRVGAAQTNAQSEIPLPLLVDHLLEAATFHAEEWGVGFSSLMPQGQSWVLARLAIQMDSYPTIGETLIIETWVEGFNKHFSARNFAFTSPTGVCYGYARTIWSIIDLESRTSVDLHTVQGIERKIAERECPIAAQSKLKAVNSDSPHHYTVKFSDIDLNRHVDSVRYIEHILDGFTLERFDQSLVHRFEINYLSEALYDMPLVMHSFNSELSNYVVEIRNEESDTPICRSKIVFRDRK